MSTWTKQNLFELGAVARGKSKHRPRQHPATPVVSFANIGNTMKFHKKLDKNI